MEIKASRCDGSVDVPKSSIDFPLLVNEKLALFVALGNAGTSYGGFAPFLHRITTYLLIITKLEPPPP